jgi:serine/threonine protein kinase
MLTTADQFLDCVRKSQLVEDAHLISFLETISRQGPGTLSPEELGERLIQSGLLTHFQVRQLLRSRWQGFLLGGKYRLLELLGAGGMGRVFLCEHTRLHTLVAVKVLSPEKTAEPATLERFHREARAAATLAHPNLVRAFDVDDEGDFSFIVMEYVHGHSLQWLVQEKGPFRLERAVACIRQAALGLQHAFESGLVHRDIKPGNILLDRQGCVKILDMGLARFFHDTQDKLTQEHNGGSILGTADYLAPEQAVDSHQATIRADIYSLGATFYFLLAGRAPFEEGTVAQKMLWHQVRQPRPVTAWRTDVPAELEAVLARMMAKDPAQRYALPQEVAEALAPWDYPLAPLLPEELPQFCPAVQRLLNQAGTPSPIASAELTPLPPSAYPSSAGRVEAGSPQAGPGSLADLLTDAPAPPPGRIPNPSLPSFSVATRPLRRNRRIATAGAAVLILALAWGGYVLHALLQPPLPGPLHAPDLSHFDPLAGINPHKVIPDYLAVGQVGQTRTVRLTVRDRERAEDGDVFLYSSLGRDNKDTKVFTIVFPRAALPELKKAGIADPYTFYMGQTLDAKGTIKYLTEGFNRPGIEIREPGQVQLVNPE